MPTPHSQTISKVIPPALKTGDTVGIVAPASYVDRARLAAGIKALEGAGYKVELDNEIGAQHMFFAGTNQRRLAEFHSMFERSHVRAIVCARGGYGSNHLLPELDLSLIKKHPKILVGYSDVTSLLTYIYDAIGLVTFHGPMVASDFDHDAAEWNSWQAALEGQSNWKISGQARPLRRGSATGELYGGCLSLLAASIGTPYECRSEGKLLFMEDINAKPYQIDRMLMQMRLAGKFEGVRGILFGEMPGCVQPGSQPYTLDEVLLAALSDLHVPIAIGFSSGHVSGKNITLPFGIDARLDVGSSVGLEILEKATQR